MTMQLQAIDLFAGIGGIRTGFAQAFGKHLNFVFASECDKFAKQTFFANYGELPQGDIAQIDAREIPNHDILLAGFPCQAFSVAGLRKGLEDTRGTLFFDVARLVEYHKPRAIFLENVKGLKSHDKGKTLAIIKETLQNLGYRVFFEVLNAKHFGVPQNRERIYIVAVLDGSFDFSPLLDVRKTSCLIEMFLQIDTMGKAAIFIFVLKLIQIKDLLLIEAKTKYLHDLERLQHISPLSVECSKITVFNSYMLHVQGALLSLHFFEMLNSTALLSASSQSAIQALACEADELQKLGLKSNQIFMIMFNESLNQSIISSSGADYEKRILSVLVGQRLDKDAITKRHDALDKSTEFDLFFVLEGRTYGIGAKRTLRERHKQFIKTAQMSPLDVMIEVILNTDPTQEKAKSIVGHGIHLFVADEVFCDHKYLQSIKGVHPCRDFTLDVLKTLGR